MGKKGKSSETLDFKVIAFPAIGILVALVAVAIICTLSIIKTAEQFSKMQGVPVVEKVSKYIDGDRFERLTKTLDKDDEWAEETRVWMLDVAQSVGCAYLFTMSPASGTTYRYIIDGSCDPSDKERFSPMGAEENIAAWSDAPLKTMETGEMTSSGMIYQKGWGWTVSTYKAIKNSKGKNVGFIGCDFEISFIIKLIARRITIIISISAIIFAVFIIIILKLKALMTQIRDNMAQIHASQEKEHRISANLFEEAQNLVVSAKETAATSQDSAAAVKEIVATMEDTNDLSENISIKIKDVSNVANNTSSDVIDGVAQLDLNVKQLHEIFDANQGTIQGIKILSEKIESIWDIVSLINNVADQAKIIAFNAELEASTAGEAGKSFRIVANEIRRLSDGIIDGTREIKEKITEVQHSSDSLILASESSTAKINLGYENARGLDEKFKNIKKSAEITAKSADDISDIIQQQASASEQILIAIKEIASGVENFSVATDNISNAAENVRKISEELNNANNEE
ncbi:MAG: hypothetical protein IKP49_12670 [Treponema sp.]|nr:hypothetical protein [Treponema sp.]